MFARANELYCVLVATILFAALPGCARAGDGGAAATASPTTDAAPEASSPAAQAAAPRPEVKVTILDVKAEGTERLELRGGTLSVREADGNLTQVPVGLEATLYQVRVLRVVEGQPPREGTTPCTRYELKSTDPAIAFAWSFWSSVTPVTRLQTATTAQGENFLLAARFGTLLLFEVGAATPSLAEYLSGPRLAPGVPISVKDLIPESVNWIKDQLYIDATVQEMQRDGEGNLTLKVSGPDPTQTAILRQKEGKWERVDGP